jgi:hypothetical protein
VVNESSNRRACSGGRSVEDVFAGESFLMAYEVTSTEICASSMSAFLFDKIIWMLARKSSIWSNRLLFSIIFHQVEIKSMAMDA